MSRYNNADYDDMAYELDEFLKEHRPSELLRIVQEAVEWWEEKNEDVKRIIVDLPSAQPEIIRCKDCKWFNDIGCSIAIADDSDRPTENDFCSFAERRTDE